MAPRPKIKTPIKIIDFSPPPARVSGFQTTDELLIRLNLDREIAFPFEKELSLYLLFIASIWPDDDERLATAARLFGATIIFLASKSASPQGTAFIKPAALKAFNSEFFCKVGGIESLLFCRSAQDFHQDIQDRLIELSSLFDVVRYLFTMTGIAPELTTLELALRAASANVFGRKQGYLGYESVRARWKKRPHTLILSDLLSNYLELGQRQPGNFKFFAHLTTLSVRWPASAIRGFRRAIETVLSNSVATKKSKLNELLSISDIQRKRRFRVHPPNDDQIEKILRLAQDHLKSPPSAERKAEIRQAARRWYREIPRPTP